MTRFIRRFVLLLLALCFAAFLFQGAQKLRWDNSVTVINPPSLDAWDPTERYEAARQAAKKFGGLK